MTIVQLVFGCLAYQWTHADYVLLHHRQEVR